MYRCAIALIIALFALSATADAQKNCRKGIPCGNSCISANKVCRIGSSAPASERAPEPARERSGAPSSGAASLYGSSSSAGQWVASSRGSTYYAASCSGGRKLAASNRIYFRSEAEAKAAGYSRSTQKGC